MQDGDLTITDGAIAGGWIKPGLDGEFGAVTLHVPRGYEAYARILHPALDSELKSVRWAEVANLLGTTAHREMQWHAILGLSDPDELRGSYEADDAVGSKWAGHDPPTGAMDLETIDALCGILATHTTDPDRCYFGLCTIVGWSDQFAADQLRPLLKLPDGRDYIVLAGPLSAASQIVFDWSKPSPSRLTFVAWSEEGPSHDPSRIDWTSREAPSLIWPADHTWFVASEVDFDSTLVGGNCELINAIVESSELEAWRVEPTDSLAYDADKINVHA